MHFLSCWETKWLRIFSERRFWP